MAGTEQPRAQRQKQLEATRVSWGKTPTGWTGPALPELQAVLTSSFPPRLPDSSVPTEVHFHALPIVSLLFLNPFSPGDVLIRLPFAFCDVTNVSFEAN